MNHGDQSEAHSSCLPMHICLVSNDTPLVSLHISTATGVFIWSTRRSFGMVLMMVSDAQKYYSLQLRPGKLITTGMFTSLRSPNYLGELITYFAYVFLSAHWVPVFVILFEMAVIWVPNMIRKDKSLSRHPDFASWKARWASESVV